MGAESVMDNIRDAFDRSGMTLEELVEGLGYEAVGKKEFGAGQRLVYGFLDIAHYTSRFPGRLIRASRAGVRAFRKDMQGKGQANLNLKK